MSIEITLCSATLGEDGKTEPPLGPLYIAGALRACDVEVDFRDYQTCADANVWSGRRLAEFLAGHASVVAISCFVDMLPAVIDAARRLRSARPDTTILLGGPGPTASAARLLELYPWIDGVVRGEGEETIQQWVAQRCGRCSSSLPIDGMAYRQDGVIISGGQRARVGNLESLPGPAYDLLDWSKYSSARIITTRGCAYQCSFCDVTALWGNRSVYRQLDDALAELEMLRNKYGKCAIGIVDDTFVQNRGRVREFCKLLIRRRAGIEWGCFGRINLMSPDLVELMAEAGCRAVFYGIDSGSQTILDRVQKVMRADTIVPVVKYSAQVFDKVEASFIWGYPFETLDDFKRTLDVAAEAAEHAPQVNVQLHMLSPLPNSPMYRSFRGRLREPEPEDRSWLLLPAVLLDKRATSIRKIVVAAPDVYPGFYTFPTPAKITKRKLLARVMSALDRTIGNTILDRKTARLMEAPDRDIERELLDAQSHPSDRIGVSLALGFFRRSRRRRGLEGAYPFDGARGPRLARQRNDETMTK